MHQNGWGRNTRNNGERRRRAAAGAPVSAGASDRSGRRHGTRTRDFSSSGVFFETDRALAPGAPIEFSLVLGRVSPGLPLRLDCEGRIVQTVPRAPVS
ncbi:MAG TPA: PilZ domain-containing protein [Methylomirabilota bacterium]|nr:PilZ domain-containing protein [Methylomirabilota bacterium]